MQTSGGGTASAQTEPNPSTSKTRAMLKKAQEELAQVKGATWLAVWLLVWIATVNLWAQVIRPKAGANGEAVCAAAPVGYPPQGYYAATRKCSSGGADHGFANPLNTTAKTCSDSGGVEAVYDQELTVMNVGKGKQWPVWKNDFDAGSAESESPTVYGQSISTSNEIGMTLKRPQGIVGLEVDNLTVHTYIVTFHTTAGDATVGKTSLGGVVPPAPFAQRFIAICSGPAITGVAVQCTDCTEASGDGTTAIGQIRSDGFKGFGESQ